jgi:glutathione S-transferase
MTSPSNTRLTLISHHLCPYVQRAVIALTEKSVPFDRIDIDLAAKPDWFLALSPLGKTPVLKVGEVPVFESAVMLEYLEDTVRPALHPADPLERAHHRGWIEFASTVLNGIGTLYSAPDASAFAKAAEALKARFGQLEAALGDGPWFAGRSFGLVDAAFGPVFRYFDLFDRIGEFGILTGLPKVAAWRQALSQRPSVRKAVAPDYELRLLDFLTRRGSHLGDMARRKADFVHESLDAVRL